MKLIIGAGRTAFDSWVSTQQDELDLLCRDDFARYAAREPSMYGST